MNTLQPVLVKADPDTNGLSVEAHHKHRRIKEMQQELMQMKTSFAAIADSFHQIRTPLHSMCGFIEIMRDGRVPDIETQNEFMTLVHEQSQYLRQFVMHILDIAALESGQMNFEKRLLSLKKIIERSADKLQKLAHEKDIIIETDTSQTLLHAEGDFNKLEQAVTILLDNTIKSSPGQSNIHIAGTTENDVVLVQIIAHSIDDTVDSVFTLFQQFSQVDNSSPDVGNATGVGIYLAKRIIEAHGGQIWMENKQNKCNILSFTIPVKFESVNQAVPRRDAITQNGHSPVSATENADQTFLTHEEYIDKPQKINSKRRPMNLKDKSLLLRLDESEWNSFMSVSLHLGVTPSLLARALLKQTLTRYAQNNKLNDLFLLFTNPAPATTPLSQRELEVLNLMAQGISNKEIADILKLSEQSIKNHVTSILYKLEANNRTQAVVLALRHNLINPSATWAPQMPGMYTSNKTENRINRGGVRR